jgi:hypothetical protein
MTRFLRLALALVSVLFAWSSAARAEQLTLGVYLPQASFATNAERSAWADKLAADLGQRAGVTVRAQVFGRREDAVAFASRVDLLVVDGLFAMAQPGEALAHASSAPALTLYTLDAKNVGALEGKVVGVTDAGAQDGRFYSNVALGGELEASRFFGELRPFKDAQTALSAVKARTIAAAFAPADHPAAQGLTVVARAGAYPVAVVLATDAKKLAATAPRLAASLAGLSLGPLGTLSAGGGSALGQARAASGPPRGLTAPALVAGGTDQRPAAPPIRLRGKSRVPSIELTAVPLAPPVLELP